MPHFRNAFPAMFLWLLLVFFTACKDSKNERAATANPASSFQAVLDEIVTANKDIPGLMLHVEAPTLGLSWNGAAGVSDVATQAPLNTNQPFRVASVTKTFVATTILKLKEAGKLTLDDPISKYISTEHRDILKGGGYDPDKIKIRHLLSHTSGLFDYAVGSRSYVTAVRENPQHRWTRTEQLQGAMKWGKPYGAPGEKYHYSDTGYILLGETIEKLSGKPLAEAMREIVDYKALDLNMTWLESLEAAPTGSLDRVHQYLDETDTYNWDPSVDLYGGGGLVSTTSDMARFFYQLFHNKVYASAATLDTMKAKVPLLPKPEAEAAKASSKHETDYRFGLEVIKIFGMDIYLHTGFWGTQVAYIPKLDAAIALNYIKGDNLFVLKRIVLMLKDMKAEAAS